MDETDTTLVHCVSLYSKKLGEEASSFSMNKYAKVHDSISRNYNQETGVMRLCNHVGVFSRTFQSTVLAGVNFCTP